jgi:hypothetical protein
MCIIVISNDEVAAWLVVKNLCQHTQKIGAWERVNL